ncbi:16S rRNA (cytidine(1402)-2'-O)-methyltransferase [Enterococcus plantarum]|uniref:16S rRNA (cytidine(1402)-2'-O)-methyltransferase n=1 Tax=Enterococcus plantarum TaxID=1077675 RepID=UPI00084D15F3|nr:16S rRNA (cytidine(1402)-2'-O)-methyltransferase [Enterococcus plantarum]OEG19840.1 16S rRNA (cytidine(1402)-2'-O)-methyltransferase [Enterococcus plantarum]
MQKQKSFDSSSIGQLYLVPTPIGNLEDMSFRCINILKEATIIASEDTRNTQKLLNHFEITTSQISFHEHNYKERIPQFIERLEAGEQIAQVSDAGMPSISDPGHELVEACIKKGINVIALPGPTAGITALIASGLPPQPFTFYGFLPRKKKEQKEILEQLKTALPTQIFYESPHRIATTIKHFSEVFGEERNAVICRELTKLHEEYLRGTLAELRDYLAENTLKGECCLLVEGADGPEVVENPDLELSIKEHIEVFITKGSSSKEAIKEVAKLRGLKKQEAYKAFHVD